LLPAGAENGSSPLVSDLDPDARDAFVGIDNRMSGQTAALLIGRLIGGRPRKVGLIVGDYAFRCHEDREIGFRAYQGTRQIGVVFR
jgi:LacI family transcriptional regulator